MKKHYSGIGQNDFSLDPNCTFYKRHDTVMNRNGSFLAGMTIVTQGSFTTMLWSLWLETTYFLFVDETKQLVILYF